jgi:hypothetical protein
LRKTFKLISLERRRGIEEDVGEEKIAENIKKTMRKREQTSCH